jgi:DNA-binding XRE family transcriptional regulator
METKRLLKLKALRVENRITQKKIAKELGISERSYAEKENGHKSFTLDEISSLSNLIKFPFNYKCSTKCSTKI